MIIEDLRKEKYLTIDIKNIISTIVENTPKKLLRNLKKIVILDKDYRKIGAFGAYKPGINRNGAEIEIMVNSLDHYPKGLLNSDEIFFYDLGKIFFHEIYHHKSAINKDRAIKKELDEHSAEIFSKEMTEKFLLKVYSQEHLKKFWGKIVQEYK